MAVYTEQKYFYELLVRGDKNGIKGAHAVYMVETLKDGEVSSQVIDRALPITMAQGDPGIPLAQVLGDVNVSALATLEAKDLLLADKDALIASERVDHAAALQAATTATQSALGERDAAVVQVQSLQGQLDALKTPVDANGVPKSVPMEKAQRILLRTPFGGATLLDAVQTAVDKMVASGTPEGREAGIIWEKSNAVERANPLLKELQPALGLTDAQIDALFVAADALS